MTQTTTPTALFTRQDYMADKCTHEQYYAQFINDAGIEMVKKSQAYKTLIKKGTKDVSKVEAEVWDRIGTAGEAANLLKQLGDFWTLSAAICINKAIARQLLKVE